MKNIWLRVKWLTVTGVIMMQGRVYTQGKLLPSSLPLTLKDSNRTVLLNSSQVSSGVLV